MPRYSYGGQALIEGVLMRGRNAIAVAFRHPDGRIVWATEQLDSGIHKTGLAKLPFVRGLVVLYETLGPRWMTPELFRFGASSLLNDVLMQIRKERTGRYQGPDYFTVD